MNREYHDGYNLSKKELRDNFLSTLTKELDRVINVIHDNCDVNEVEDILKDVGLRNEDDLTIYVIPVDTAERFGFYNYLDQHKYDAIISYAKGHGQALTPAQFQKEFNENENYAIHNFIFIH